MFQVFGRYAYARIGETEIVEVLVLTETVDVDLNIRCYAQSNRLSRLLRDISVLTRMDEAANMISHLY